MTRSVGVVAFWLLGSLWIKLAAGAEAPARVVSPLSPAQSLRQFQLSPGLRMEIVAAEPKVIDPVSMAFDEDGALWVVEMRDYPHGPSAEHPARSRVRRLIDKDGDGRFETATTFADDLNFATGILPWRGGVLVTAAGELVHLRDMDGDGRAEQREVWFRGFAEENEQLRANHPRFGFDNRIYVASGLRGGRITGLGTFARGGGAIDLGGRDFCFDPQTGAAEAVTGPAQFGLSFDDFGNRFFCSNRNPCRHAVLEGRYLARNRYFAASQTVEDVAPTENEARVYPLSRAWTTSNLHAGQFTAACGVTIYRGNLLGEEYQGNSFTCEPTGNLVHRDVLVPQGATFRAAPAPEAKEFLATVDDWFRPVDLANGPDGALYVVDMYRAVIEHPDWVPDEIKKRPDLHHGNDRGRIYRIVPAEGRVERRFPRLSKATDGELARLVGSSRVWERETAARLLFERMPRGEGEVAETLRALAVQSPRPEGRFQALNAADGLGMLTVDVLAEALTDRDPRVATAAIRLSESRLIDEEKLRTGVLNLAESRDAGVRKQAALSLGALSWGAEHVASEAVAKALAAAVLADPEDKWVRGAVFSSLRDPSGFLSLLFARTDWGNGEGEMDVVWRGCGRMAGAKGDVERMLEMLGEEQRRWQQEAAAGEPGIAGWGARQRAWFEVLLGLAEGMPGGIKKLREILQGERTSKEKADVFVNSGLKVARTMVVDETESVPRRSRGVEWLRLGAFADVREALAGLLGEPRPAEVQIAALEALASYNAEDWAELLLANLPSRAPAVRRRAQALLVQDPQGAKRLLSAIEAKRLSPLDLDAGHVSSLLQSREPEIRERAERLWREGASGQDRQEVTARYLPALERTGEVGRGKQVFEKNCAICHRVDGVGVQVGPDISDPASKTLAMLLTDILEPNRAIDGNYRAYSVVKSDGVVLSGIIVNETAASVTLKQQENKEITLRRDEIETLRAGSASYMPEGLERTISVEEMADLLAFLKNWRYVGGEAGGAPPRKQPRPQP